MKKKNNIFRRLIDKLFLLCGYSRSEKTVTTVYEVRKVIPEITLDLVNSKYQRMLCSMYGIEKAKEIYRRVKENDSEKVMESSFNEMMEVLAKKQAPPAYAYRDPLNSTNFAIKVPNTIESKFNEPSLIEIAEKYKSGELKETMNQPMNLQHPTVWSKFKNKAYSLVRGETVK